MSEPCDGAEGRSVMICADCLPTMSQKLSTAASVDAHFAVCSCCNDVKVIVAIGVRAHTMLRQRGMRL